MSNLQTIQTIYDAFGRGDVPAILATLRDDVEWEYDATAAEVDWLRARSGHAGAAAFFASLAAVDIERFAVKTIAEAGQTVIVLVDIEFVVKATGKRVAEEDETHIWHFDDAGRVARFRHRVDTARHAAACRG